MAIIPYIWHVELLLLVMFRELVWGGPTYEGRRWILEYVGLVLHYVPAGLSLSLVMDMLIVTPIIITFFSCCNIANESGETPLDIAKRLKHMHCEELVSVASFCVLCIYKQNHVWIFNSLQLNIQWIYSNRNSCILRNSYMLIWSYMLLRRKLYFFLDALEMLNFLGPGDDSVWAISPRSTSLWHPVEM